MGRHKMWLLALTLISLLSVHAIDIANEFVDEDADAVVVEALKDDEGSGRSGRQFSFSTGQYPASTIEVESLGSVGTVRSEYNVHPVTSSFDVVPLVVVVENIGKLSIRLCFSVVYLKVVVALNPVNVQIDADRVTVLSVHQPVTVHVVVIVTWVVWGGNTPTVVKVVTGASSVQVDLTSLDVEGFQTSSIWELWWSSRYSTD